jgi:uncharacterized Tic20 family protein
MSNELEASPNIHIYKPKRATLALNIFSMLFIWIVMGIPLVALALMVTSLIRNQSEFISLAMAFGCLLTPLIILMGLNIILVTISTILSFFSYIKTSPDGIEQKYALSKHIRCNWADVDKVGKLFLFTDVIYLNSYEVVGTSLSLKSPFRFLRPKQGFISLTGFEGWSEGQLADDLRQSAPQLFENQPSSQAVQTENNREVQPVEAPSISQEIRLLAAISHASVLFPNIGFLVPIGIYATQKKKSSYLGSQALQALIWQMVMFVFTILMSSCMVGSIFIPVLFAASTQNERFIGLSGGGIFVAVIISVFLMTFGNLAFVVYGIIGAVMTYQGKDFRYVLIGNRIARGKSAKPTNSA